MRMMGMISLVLLSVAQAAWASQDLVKDPDGKTLAILLDCNECKEPKDEATCESGVEDGFRDGHRCGKCLLKANFGTRIAHAYDLSFVGYLKDKDGQPVKGRFVRILMPNTWTVRTRTTTDGMFRLMLGATLERQQKKPVTIDLGVRTVSPDQKSPYSMYLLPEDHKSCEAKNES